MIILEIFNFGIEEQKMTFKEHELQLKAQEAAARKALEKKGFKDYFKKKYFKLYKEMLNKIRILIGYFYLIYIIVKKYIEIYMYSTVHTIFDFSVIQFLCMYNCKSYILFY